MTNIVSRSQLVHQFGAELIRELEEDGSLAFEEVEGVEVIHVDDLPDELVLEEDPEDDSEEEDDDDHLEIE